jgi:hypothetical protein
MKRAYQFHFVTSDEGREVCQEAQRWSPSLHDAGACACKDTAGGEAEKRRIYQVC